MLIIFDLDDTLIQTTDTFTPHQLRQAVIKMVESGLCVPNMEEAVSHIQRLDKLNMSARGTLRDFLANYAGTKKFFKIGIKELYENFSFTQPVIPMRGAKEILGELSKEHDIGLITVGIATQQLKKLESAGIERALFSKIIVCESNEKKNYYKTLLHEFKVEASQVLVCGDRIQRDLKPARELGFTTVHLRQGRGRLEPKSSKDVDVSIQELGELRGVIEELKLRKRKKENLCQ